MISAKELKAYFTKCGTPRLEAIHKQIEVILTERVLAKESREAKAIGGVLKWKPLKEPEPKQLDLDLAWPNTAVLPKQAKPWPGLTPATGKAEPQNQLPTRAGKSNDR